MQDKKQTRSEQKASEIERIRTLQAEHECPVKSERFLKKMSNADRLLLLQELEASAQLIVDSIDDVLLLYTID